jgi:hypothetical protein
LSSFRLAAEALPLSEYTRIPLRLGMSFTT